MNNNGNKKSNNNVMTSLLAIMTAVLIATMTSCAKFTYRDYSTAQDEEPVYDAQNFNNYENVDVNITGNGDGHVYSIYYANPYSEEGQLAVDPALIARTPINTTLRVPNGADSIWIIGDGQLRAVTLGDINIGRDKAAPRAAATRAGKDIMQGFPAPQDPEGSAREYVYVPQDLLDVVNNKYYPEKKFNVKREDMYKCPDLVITEPTHLKLTYLGNGIAPDKNQFQGRFFIYTYPTEKQDNLTLADCTFYGIQLANSKKPDFMQLVEVNVKDIINKENSVNPLLCEKNEVWDYTHANGVRSRVDLGVIPAGVNVGFCLNTYWNKCGTRFSTPNINLELGRHDYYIDKNFTTYIGKTIKYDDEEGDFTIERMISGAFVQHVEEYDCMVVGMELSLPESGRLTYDADFNDMVVLVETDRDVRMACEPVPTPDIDEKNVEHGMLLFEDSYPSEGDCDFNDVVVEYKLYYDAKNKNKRKLKMIKAALLAKGCGYSNEFGFVVDGVKVPLFTNIQGYENVGDELVTGPIEEVVWTPEGEATEAIPYLFNGKDYIRSDMFDKNLFPYILDIPSNGKKENDFRWCKEKCSMRRAYNFDNHGNHYGWYKNHKDPTIIINRKY